MNATKPATRGRPKIGFILARSFTLSAFALFVDTIRLASDVDDRSGRVLADWQVLASTQHLITSSCGVQVAPTSNLVDPAEFSYIVVVGGRLNQEAPVDRATLDYLRRAAARNVPLIGVCTGTFILAEAGLMKRHQTCVSWLHYDEFRERFPDHPLRADRIYNLDRDRGSCPGGGSAVDIAAALVRRHISAEAEKNALEVLQVDRARSSSDVQPRRPLAMECNDPRVRSVLIMMERHTQDTIPIDKLAESVGLSRRQLERLFTAKTKKSLARTYRKVRLERARQLLVHTRIPLIAIAMEVGFENSSHFSRVFRETYGHTPSSLRSAT